MTLWNKLARETKNDDDLYRPFLDRLGADHIECIEFINFGDPIEESFLEDIKIKNTCLFHGRYFIKVSI